MRCCTPFNVIKRVKIPSSYHVTFVLVNKFVCDTHLFSPLIVYPVLNTLEGVKRVLFYTIPSEFDEKVVIGETVQYKSTDVTTDDVGYSTVQGNTCVFRRESV